MLRLGVWSIAGSVLAVLLSGCGVAMHEAAPFAGPQGISGVLHGGQQPVAGVSVQLYAVGSGGDGTAATPLLTQAVTSTAAGNFTLTGFFNCPSPSALVYLVGTGGNPGLGSGQSNPQLALMAALGPCGNLTSSTFVSVNELTTVSAVYALAPFMTAPSMMASGASDQTQLANAFALSSEWVNPASGATPGTNVPAGATVPVAQIDTIADILATCINSSGGISGDGSVCGSFLSLTTPPGGKAPTDTISALINLADNPTLNTASLYALATPTSPYQPTQPLQPLDLSVHFLGSALQFTPTGVLTFPSTVAGSSASAQNITVTNNGPGAITLTSVGLLGANASDFSQTDNCPSTLAYQGSCTIFVGFSPSWTGTRTANLVIAGSASNAPASIPLSGAATAGSSTYGSVAISPASLSFDDFSAAQTVTLTNNGLASLPIQSINVTAGFTQTNNCGAVLYGQSICRIVVSAVPSVTGPSTGTLSVLDSDTTDPQTVGLTNTLDTLFPFGTWPVGKQSTFSLTIQPVEGAGHQYYANASLSGPNAGDFLFLNGNSCSSEPDACYLYVAFKPTAAGPRYAVVTSTTGTYVVYGIGASTGGAAAAFTPVQSFNGTEHIPATPVTLTLTNTGLTTLQMAGTSAFSTSTAESSITATACGTLAPGASCTSTLNYTPIAAGSRSFTVYVNDSASGTQFSTQIFAVVSYMPPNASPTQLTFPPTHLHATSATQTVKVSNPDGHPLTVGFANCSGQCATDFNFSPTTCATVTCTITVSYSPVTASQYFDSRSLAVVDTVSTRQAQIGLTGYAGVPNLVFTPNPLNFASRPVGSTSTAQSITITNSGDGYGNITATAPAGPTLGTTGSDFVYGGFTGTADGNILSVYPGATAASGIALMYSFAPTASGTRNATVQITDYYAGAALTTLTLAGSAF